MGLSMSLAGVAIGLTRRTPSTPESAEAEVRKPVNADPLPEAWKHKFNVAETELQVADDGKDGQSFTVVTIAPKTSRPDKCLIYVHGGAYLRPITKYHWSLIEKIVVEGGTTVVVPIYGRIPHHTVDEAYRFLHKVYTKVIEDHGGKEKVHVALAGDSAGGGLALGFCQDLIAKGVSPRPSRLLLISPWLDLKLRNPAIATIDDPWLHPVGLRHFGAAWDAENKDDYRVSPLFGSLERLPHIDLWIGTRDIFRADCMQLAEKINERNKQGKRESDATMASPVEGGTSGGGAEAKETTIKVRVCEGGLHVYPILPSFIPQAKQGANEVVEAVREWMAIANGGGTTTTTS
jgi:epsilon-lactone hydrolase